MWNNYFFSALAGTTWYFQFFFYTMGETQMGAYKFSSWTLHMASIIIFSSLWGIALHEWRGASAATRSAHPRNWPSCRAWNWVVGNSTSTLSRTDYPDAAGRTLPWEHPCG
jgi:hypothetical protein